MKRDTLRILCLAVLAGAPLCADAAVHRVPQNFATIQAAINAAADGDTVRVAAGTYGENLVIQNKAIALIGAGAATTIIDGGSSGRVILVENQGTAGEVTVAGFTIRNGGSFEPGAHEGMGIHAEGTLVVRDNVLTGHAGCRGAALRVVGNIKLLRNRIHANTALGNHICSTHAVDLFVGGLNYIERNVITDHQFSGMEVYTDGGTAYIRHNVFRNNTGSTEFTSEWGGLKASGDLIVDNNLFVNNSGGTSGGVTLNQQEFGHGYVRHNSFCGNQGGSASAMHIRATTGLNLVVANNLLDDSQEFVPEITCEDVPIALGITNVFASSLNPPTFGTCTP